MPGTTREWPEWREYSELDKSSVGDTAFIEAMQSIISEYGEEALRKSWLETCERLSDITDEIASSGTDYIPVFESESILKNGFSTKEALRFRKVGCCIVRDVIPEKDAKQLYRDLETYIADNKSKISGWPAESPSMLLLYNSPTQIAIRTHKNHLKLQRIMNEVWHGYSDDTSPEPLLYTDGIRNRPPKQAFLGLGPHIDAGSLARWADPNYRKVYEHIFSGNPDLHDCYNLEVRKTADQYMFPGAGHSTIFRSFQGWTALSRSAPSEGGIMLYPNVATAIAYVLLRPFFNPPKNEAEIMNAAKWTFNNRTPWFPGTFKEQSQFLSPSSHPHLRLKECLMNLPTMKAGDTVWWHTDVRSTNPFSYYQKLTTSVVPCS